MEAWAEVGRQGCQWDQGHTCRVGCFVERTGRVPSGHRGSELSMCWALLGTPILLEEKSGASLATRCPHCPARWSLGVLFLQ